MVPTNRLLHLLWPALLVLLVLSLSGCEGDSPQPIPLYGPNLALDLPDTLTGGQASGGAAALADPGGAAGRFSHEPCHYLGHGNGDPFRNGHTMIRFLVGAVASWNCIADAVVGFVDYLVFLGVPFDGTPLDIASGNAGYQAGDATWISVNELSATQTVVMLYWTAVGVSPGAGDAGFYLYWDNTGGNVVGKLIVDPAKVADDPMQPHNPVTDPTHLRLDFNHTAASKTGDMYLGFDSTQHPWVEGWRIQVVKRLDAVYPRYTAKGAIKMTAQWDPAYPGTDIPQLNGFAVADSIGVGAAIAQMADLGIVLFPLDADADNLGAFLFTKDDRYYFGGGAPVIYKDVTLASYHSLKSIGTGGLITSDADVDTLLAASVILNGSVVPYNGNEYVGCTGTPAAGDCERFLNALFSGAQFEAEGNVGSEPATGDPRRDALDGATYFANACPAEAGGCTWDDTDVFEMVP